jgi:hypothetical protein
MAKPFRETLKTKDFTVTAEVGPVKGSSVSSILSFSKTRLML